MKKPMTIKQALKKAIELWGPKACVQERPKPTVSKSGAILTERFTVGRVEMGMFFCVKGHGTSFEAAFENAAQAEEYDRKRMAELRAKHGLPVAKALMGK